MRKYVFLHPPGRGAHLDSRETTTDSNKSKNIWRGSIGEAIRIITFNSGHYAPELTLAQALRTEDPCA